MARGGRSFPLHPAYRRTRAIVAAPTPVSNSASFVEEALQGIVSGASAAGATPTTAVLDTFSGASMGANWTQMDSFDPLPSVSGGVVVASASSASGYWNPQTFGPDCEVYATVGGTRAEMNLWLRANSFQASAAPLVGYLLTFDAGGTRVGIWKANGSGGIVQLGGYVTVSSVDATHFTAVGNVLTGYVLSSGVWSQVIQQTDTDFPAAGYLCFVIQGSGETMDNFGGGTLSASPLVLPVESGDGISQSAISTVESLKQVSGSFGRTARGSTLDTGYSGARAATSFTITTPTLVTAIAAWVDIGAFPCVSRAAIYANSAGAPGARLALTSDVTLPVGTQQQAIWPFATPVLLAPGTYWLADGFDTGAGATVGHWCEPLGTGSHVYNTASGALPDPFGTPTTSTTAGDLDIAAVTLPVAQTNIDELGGVSGTVQVPEESAKGIAATDALIEESVRGISQTGATVDESIRPISTTALDPLEAALGITSFLAAVEEETKGVASTEASPLESIQVAAVATSSFVEEALQAVSSSSTGSSGVAYVNEAHANSDSTQTASYTPSSWLTSVTPGNYMVLELTLFSGGLGWTPNTPAGWTLLGMSTFYGNSGSQRTGVFGKIATSGDASVPTFSAGGNAYWEMSVLEYSGVDPTTPVDGTMVKTNLNLSGGTVDVPAITTSGPNRMIVDGVCHTSLLTFTAPAGENRRENNQNAFAAITMAMADAIAASAGTVAARTYTYTGSVGSGTGFQYSLALAPAPATGAPFPLESVQAVAATATEPEESARAISTVVAEPVEEQQGVTATGAADPLEATRGVAATDALNEEAVGGIASASAFSEDAGGGVASVASFTEESLQLVTANGAIMQGGVLDNFNRANNTSLGTGWSTWNNSMPGISGNAAVPQNTAGSIYQGHYTASGFTNLADQEWYLTVAGMPASASGWIGLRARGTTNTAPGATFSGYSARLFKDGLVHLLREDANAQAWLITANVAALTVGDKLGLRVVGSRVEVWVFQSGVWSLVIATTDSTYATGDGGILVSQSASGVAADDFGGGPITAWVIEEQQPVSTSVTVPEEETKGIATTDALNEEAGGGVAQTGAETIETTQPLSTTALDPLEALQAVQATDDEPIEAVQPATPVSQTASFPLEELQALAATGATSEESSLPISTTALDPLETAMGVTATGAADPVEAAKGIAATNSEPVEAGQGIAKAQAVPDESLQGVAGTGGLPDESAGAVASTAQESAESVEPLQTTASSPVESTLPTSTSSTVPVEEQRGVTQTVGPDPVEAGGGVASSDQTAIESTQSLAATGQVPDEAAGGVAATGAETVESTLPVQTTATDPVESQRAVATSAVPPVEETGGVATSASEPLDASGGVASTAGEPLDAARGVVSASQTTEEATQPVGPTTASEPLEAEQGVSQASTSRIESAGGVAASSAENVEAAEGVASADDLFIESTQPGAVLQSGILPLESLEAIAADAASTEESAKPVSSSGSLPDEAGKGVSSAAASPLDALAGVLAEMSSTLDSTQTISTVASSPVEAGQGIAQTLAASVEAAEDLAAAAGSLIESVQALATSFDLPFEELQAVAAAAAAAVEAGKGVSSTGTVPDEALGGVASDSGLPIESANPATTPVATTAAFYIEALEGLAVPAVEPVEEIRPVASSASSTIEALRPIAAVVALALEANLGVRATGTTPLDALRNVLSALGLPNESIQPVAGAIAVLPIESSLIQTVAVFAVLPIESKLAIAGVTFGYDTAENDGQASDIAVAESAGYTAVAFTVEGGDVQKAFATTTDVPASTGDASDKRAGT